ncbi:lycopene cyclase domain-containing protein [Brevibacterium luteolum]|uniref:Lycopene cyclase domain-containing protein n=1 Tax=Brevibacterium luteolum TaxID=199591 RepID=A0A849AT97_9MICO|nr:lycopene cyclase domain-containing protein [Brevibacterium luteolum]NNG80039.1 lycopene cyclase domain-containing protein [Brevibacterium luteolum]
MSFVYLGCLLFSIAGMALLDWRHQLFWFADCKRAAIVHGVGLATFLLWDAAGIVFGVFYRGDSPYMTGIELAPELPVEEVFFLFFLCWVTMVVFTRSMRILTHLRSTDEPGPEPTGTGTPGTGGGRP